MRPALGLVFGLAMLPSVGRGHVVGGTGPTATVNLFGSRTADLDLDGDGNPEITLSALWDVGGWVVGDAQIEASSNSTLLFTSTALPAGSVIDGSLSFSNSSLHEHAEVHAMQPSLNQPGGVLNGDYGFRFISSGETHYGWLDALVETSGYAPGAQANVNLWAYESEPNTPITVGAAPSRRARRCCSSRRQPCSGVVTEFSRTGGFHACSRHLPRCGMRSFTARQSTLFGRYLMMIRVR